MEENNINQDVTNEGEVNVQDNDVNGEQTPNVEGRKDETPKEGVKTFTQEEVEKMIQKQADKRVTEALKTAKGKWESEYQTKLKAEKEEAERLAKMSAKERQEEELRKVQKEIDIERAEFEKQRDEFKREKIALATVKELSAKNLPVEFADFLVTADEDATKNNVAKFEEQWNTLLQNAIEKHVHERLQNHKEPKQAPKAEPKMMTRKEFANLPFAERKKLIDENPDLVRQILAQ